MVVKKIDDINISASVPSASSTQTLSSSTDFCTNNNNNNNDLSSHESEIASNFNNNNNKKNNQNKKLNIKTNLNKLISNSDILVRLDRKNHHQEQQQRHLYIEEKELHPSLPQRIFYENILSDLKNNQKSPLCNTHANSNSTSSLNEQYILNFNYRNQFLNKTDSTKTTTTAAAEKPANEAPSSTDDECLVEFIEDFNLEDDDFGSSLSTTSSSSHSDAVAAAATANQTSHNNNNEIKLSYQQQKTNSLELPTFSSSISKSSDDVNSLSISELSGSPISSSASSSNQTSEPSIDHVTASALTVETDLSNDADEAANDVCLLTPTQFSNFRHKELEDKNENEEEDEESRRNTVTYSTSSLLHEYQMKNNIFMTINVENDVTPLDHDQNSILQLRNELLNSNNPCLSRQDSTKSKSKDSKLSSGKSTISSANSLFLACEVASLSSLTSDYSQFDFLANNNTNTVINNNVNSAVTTNKIVMPVAETYHVDTPTKKSSSNANSNGSITSFFFSNSLFGNKKSSTLNTPEKSSNITTCPSSNTNNLKSSQTHSQSVKLSPTSNKAATNTTTTANTSSSSSSNKTLDLIASKFFNLKSASTNKNNSKTIQNNPAPQIQDNKQNIEFSMATSSSSSSLVNFNSDLIDTYSDNTSLKTNHSFNNLAGVSSIQVPSSVLIFENRPSNLPAKSQQEALKHKQEYEKMIQIAKKKEKKENQTKLKKYEQQMKKEDFMANSLKIWNNEILTNWNDQKIAKRTHQLWWHGLPPSIRGKVWKLAIGNELNLTKESYSFYEKKAQQKLETLSKKEDKSSDETITESEKPNESSSSVELIKLDVSRTFPQLCFFQRDGPYHDALHGVLGAYACFNPRMGYVQGMSFLTAIFLLNMEAHDAFICLSNLLNSKLLLACFCMDQAKMNRYFRVHQILLEHNLPKLYRHFEEQKVKPDLYLIEWLFTLFSKSLPLDVMSRVWDVFFRDKEEFLFRTALGILNLYKDTLLQMDFIHIVQFLSKLPDNINSTLLFKSIEQIETSIDDLYFTFEHLIADTPTSLYHSNSKASSGSGSHSSSSASPP